RLRMERTTRDAPKQVVFERRERDGRSHSVWVLRASIDELDGGAASRLTMHLHYGGALWGPVLERLLGDEIERSKPRLLALLRAEGCPTPAAAFEREAQSEAFAEGRFGQGLVDRSRAEGASVLEQEQVGVTRRDLVDVVRNENRRRRVGLGRELRE